MPKRFYHRCYGNYNGWSEFNVSNNFPTSSLKELIERQVQHSTIPSNYIDELGKVLCLYEVVGANDYLYILNTKYNVLAGNELTKGRDSNYSQAYVFHMEDVIDNPNLFLAISEKHFPTDFQYSEDAVAKTSNISEILEYDGCLTIQEALQIARLTEQNYKMLIKFITAEKMLKRVKKPIYIQYDGTKQQMKALMYCIFYGLPYFLRRSISMSSSKVDDSSYADIIFSIHASKFDHYFIPETGMCTYEERLIRAITRSNFIDVLCTKVPINKFNKYYSLLEEEIKELGGSKYTSRELLIILKIMFWDDSDLNSLSSEEINNNIVDLLEVHQYGNKILDKKLDFLLKEIINRKELLLPMAEERLNDCVTLSQNSSLKETVLNYQINQIYNLPIEKAIHKLDTLPLETFHLYINAIDKDGNEGYELIKAYYQYYLKEKTNDFSDVSRFVDEVEELNSGTELIKQAKDRYTEIMKGLLYENLEQNIDEYTEKMHLICDDAYEVDSYVEEVKRYYWDHFSLDMFNYNKKTEYRLLKTKHNQSELAELAYTLILAYFELSNDDFIKYLIKFLSKYSYQIESEQLKQIVCLLNRERCLVERDYSTQYTEWLEIICDCNNSASRNLICEIYEMLKNNKFTTHKEYLKKLKKYFRQNHISESIAIRVTDIIYTHYCDVDSDETKVPLDNWLLIAKPKYENAFEIFDDIDPFFMQDDETKIKSDCLEGIDNEYRIDAYVYGKSKFKHSKTIKRYYSTISKKHKEKKFEDKSNIEKSNDSSLGKFFSRFKK